MQKLYTQLIRILNISSQRQGILNLGDRVNECFAWDILAIWVKTQELSFWWPHFVFIILISLHSNLQEIVKFSDDAKVPAFFFFLTTECNIVVQANRSVAAWRFSVVVMVSAQAINILMFPQWL